jgi:mono/diheme cytochrome c family protein
MGQVKLRSALCGILCCALLGFGCREKQPAAAAQRGSPGLQAADSSSHPDSLATGATLSYEQRQGKHVYAKYCAVCHGEEGKGDGFNSFNLDPKPRDFTDAKYMNELTDDRMVQTVSGGGRSVNRSALMPTWGGRLSKEEIRYVVSYVRVFASHP